ncbi:hypothetical protein J5N97_005222 [Dioscorea zingiberensis]|uniref:protein acetyllysine N-acetyltransferase n=1 Tax=Dioscorea zingiberensis TaxID=325984 RepID=A0A9D5HSI4_9LILI|nr:hypothetical protein J5N97_005222 [Dioscorea zingiberensis]
MSEIFDPPDVLQQKIEELAIMIQKSKHLVAFTGAGISTSCGIPDFRGPKGIWTLQREGKALPEASLPFHCARPSLTHMALVELERAGILKFVISQNVDCLHLRSGIPRQKLAELHGNSFRELCPSCGEEYDALPPKEMNLAEKHCRTADIVLCLGTSLQITPACNLPHENNYWRRKDCDSQSSGVMQLLDFRIPPYIRIDLVQLILRHVPKKKTNVRWTLRLTSIHGQKASLPFLKSIEILFPERPDMKPAFLQKQPFYLERETSRRKSFIMALKFNFSDGCGCSSTMIEWPVDFQVKKESFTFGKNNVLQELMDVANKESQCGQHAIIERKVLPRSEITIDAIVTNLVKYNNAENTKPVEAIPIANTNGIKRCSVSTKGTRTSRKRSKLA